MTPGTACRSISRRRLQLAGVSPLDIAAATVEVQQGLAVLLQAKVLWVPTLNAGVDYFRHDGVQQNIFTGALFQKGRQSLFVGGGPSLNVALTDAIYEPLAQRRVVAARVANVQTARNDVLLAVSQAYFALQDARGRLVGVDATIVRARTAGRSRGRAGPSLDRSAGNQPGEGRAAKPEADARNRAFAIGGSPARRWRRFCSLIPRPCSSRSSPRSFRSH